MQTPAIRRLLAAALPVSLAFAVTGASPSRAVDDAKPTPTCGVSKTDAATDSADPQTGAKHDPLELTGGFMKHEPAKGAEATTTNFVIKDLTMDLPQGSSSMMWVMKFTSDKDRFVRAVHDYSGATVFEHGELVVNATGNLPRYEYRGTVPGKIWEGPAGVIQLVVPAEIGGKDGAALKNLVVEAQSGKTAVPAAGPATPSRGLSYVNDDLGLGSWAVAKCDGSTPAPATGGGDPAPGTSPTTGTQPTPTTGPTALPVKLVTTKAKAKAAKKGKKLTLKLKSSEPIKQLAAQIRNAKSTFGVGKVAAINGNGKVTIKLKKALKKGSYFVDIAGNDGQGRHRTTSAKLTVK